MAVINEAGVPDSGPINDDIVQLFLDSIRERDDALLMLTLPGLPTRVVCQGYLQHDGTRVRSLRGVKFIPHYIFGKRPAGPTFIEIELNLDRIHDLGYRYEENLGYVLRWSSPFGILELASLERPVDVE